MAKASNSPRQIFPESNNDEMWIIGNDSPDSNVLVTVSNKHGEKTALISGDKIVESAAKLFVQAPPERVITGNKVWYVRTTAALQVLGFRSLACAETEPSSVNPVREYTVKYTRISPFPGGIATECERTVACPVMVKRAVTPPLFGARSQFVADIAAATHAASTAAPAAMRFGSCNPR